MVNFLGHTIELSSTLKALGWHCALHTIYKPVAVNNKCPRCKWQYLNKVCIENSVHLKERVPAGIIREGESISVKVELYESDPSLLWTHPLPPSYPSVMTHVFLKPRPVKDLATVLATSPVLKSSTKSANERHSGVIQTLHSLVWHTQTYKMVLHHSLATTCANCM